MKTKNQEHQFCCRGRRCSKILPGVCSLWSLRLMLSLSLRFICTIWNLSAQQETSVHRRHEILWNKITSEGSLGMLLIDRHSAVKYGERPTSPVKSWSKIWWFRCWVPHCSCPLLWLLQTRKDACQHILKIKIEWSSQNLKVKGTVFFLWREILSIALMNTRETRIFLSNLTALPHSYGSVCVIKGYG